MFYTHHSGTIGNRVEVDVLLFYTHHSGTIGNRVEIDIPLFYTHHSGTIGNRVEVDVPVLPSYSMCVGVTPDHVLHHALDLVSCQHTRAQLTIWQSLV